MLAEEKRKLRAEKLLVQERILEAIRREIAAEVMAEMFGAEEDTRLLTTHELMLILADRLGKK